MKYLQLHVLNANDEMSSSEILSPKVEAAEEYAVDKMGLKYKIDLALTNRMAGLLIPEDQVGGRTYASDFIMMDVESAEFLTEMLVHELAHAIRWQENPEYIQRLFDDLILEGLGVAVEAEYAKNSNERSFFIRTMMERSDAENQQVLRQLKAELWDARYDNYRIFIEGEGLPRWAGYGLGYYLVQQYLAKTNKTIFETLATEYAEFENILREMIEGA